MTAAIQPHQTPISTCMALVAACTPLNVNGGTGRGLLSILQDYLFPLVQLEDGKKSIFIRFSETNEKRYISACTDENREVAKVAFSFLPIRPQVSAAAAVPTVWDYYGLQGDHCALKPDAGAKIMIDSNECAHYSQDAYKDAQAEAIQSLFEWGYEMGCQGRLLVSNSHEDKEASSFWYRLGFRSMTPGTDLSVTGEVIPKHRRENDALFQQQEDGSRSLYVKSLILFLPEVPGRFSLKDFFKEKVDKQIALRKKCEEYVDGFRKNQPIELNGAQNEPGFARLALRLLGF